MKEDAKYLVYEYEGTLSNMENAKALLCWEGTFDSSTSPFLPALYGCLDIVTILGLHSVRWHIETGSLLQGFARL